MSPTLGHRSVLTLITVIATLAGILVVGILGFAFTFFVLGDGYGSLVGLVLMLAGIVAVIAFGSRALHRRLGTEED